jgi:hypothetical protein
MSNVVFKIGVQSLGRNARVEDSCSWFLATRDLFKICLNFVFLEEKKKKKRHVWENYLGQAPLIPDSSIY